MVQVLVLEEQEQEEVADNGGGSWNQGGGSWSGGFPGGQVGKFFNCLTIFEKKTGDSMDVAAAHRPHLARWARSRTVARVCGSQAAFTLNQSFQIIFLATGEATWCCAQT